MDSSLAARLTVVPLFADLTADDLGAVGDELSLRPLRRGETLVQEGGVDNDLHVVLRGEFEVVLGAGTEQEQVVATLVEGDVTGEVAAVAGGVRSATVRAVGAASVVTCTSRGLDVLLDRRPELGTELARLAGERLRATALSGHLTRLLDAPPAAVVAQLVDGATWVRLDAGAALCTEGEPADAAFVVVAGRLRAQQEREDGSTVPLGHVGRGDIVGESALLDPAARRGATVVAVRDSVVARIDRTALDAVVEEHPAAVLPVVRTVLARVQQRHERRTPPVALAVGVVPGDGAAVAELAGGLARHLRRYGSVLLAGPREVEAATGDDVGDVAGSGAAALRLAQWQDRVEEEHAFVVWVGAPGATAWNRRVRARSDEVIVTAAADGDPSDLTVAAREDNGHEAGGGATVTLALLHEATTVLPSGTGRWLGPGIDRHVHVRRGTDEDVARLARLVTGRPVCVVLSGGGARGLGHIGALAELQAAGIPIDVLAGSSVGGPIAMTWALWRDFDRVIESTTRGFSGVVDYTLPVASLASARRLSANIAEQTSGMGLEDAWLPLQVTTTDLTAARPVYHDRGDATTLLRATVSIPGVFPPVAIDGHQHIDGGVTDNLPIGEVRRRHRGATIIAVDVSPPRGPSAKDEWDLGVSGWGLLARRLTPGLRAPRVPGVAGSILASTIVAASGLRDRLVSAGVADAYFHLGIRDYGLLDFDEVPQIAARGREAAAPLIAAWLEDHEPTW